MHAPIPAQGFVSSMARLRFGCLWLVPFVAIVFGLSGCKHQQARAQAEDEDREKEPEIKTIGDVTSVANAQPIPVSGVGLVVGLDGTGGNPTHDGFLSILEEDLKKRGVENVKSILSSPTTSIVLVSTVIPPGAHKGDPLDLDISLPPQSRTTSLRGGFLKECYLKDFDFTKNLDPNYGGANRLLVGHSLAKASGPLLVGFGVGADVTRERQARIWGGGKTIMNDRPFFLFLNEDSQRAPVAQKVADRINETMQGPYHGAFSQLATAHDNKNVYLRVPHQYSLNLPRFLRVVRLIPLQDGPIVRGVYRRHLAEDLLDPKRTVTAALRLEACGADSIDLLKRGLGSDHALVRFSSAEALAYLGSPTCGEELAKIVEEQPALRSYSLTAMASLDEAICHVKLRELQSSNSVETRYGAFRALRALDEHDPSVQGELLNDSFWVHHVAPGSQPLVHLSSSRRAEIVLFGDNVSLVPPFSFLAGEFTVTAGKNDDKCTISRLSVKYGTSRKQCGLKLETVLRSMADMGGMYPEVVELLRQAGSCQTMTCGLAIDALPQATSVYELAKNGSENPDFIKTDQEILDAKADFSATPTLFEKSASRRARPTVTNDDVSTLSEKKPKDEKRTAERKSK